LLPENATTEKLLQTLVGYNGAFIWVDAAMQDVVDILRERDVSWATIGQALAVSEHAVPYSRGPLGERSFRHRSRRFA